MIKPINDLAHHIELLRDDLNAAISTVLDSRWYVLGAYPDLPKGFAGFP